MYEGALRHGPVRFEHTQFSVLSSELKGLYIRYAALAQDIGDAVTKAHRCVAFPNLYQHRVQSFYLEDPTKPGHRKALVFFLVDPTRRVPSTTDVTPQQCEWVTEAMRGAGANSALARLPVEILMTISEGNEGTISRLEAEKHREESMNERTVSLKESFDR